MKTIAIIGAGQIGSRHLQSLANLNNTISLIVVDPNEAALQTSKQRYNEVAQHHSPEVNYLSDLGLLPRAIDIAIVATNSMIRASIVEALLAKCKVTYLILEKVLFPTLSNYDLIKKQLKNAGTTAWVNCPRRSFDYYTFLKNELKSPISMEVAGNNWGLASNAIHFLDVFSFLLDDAEIELDNENLANTIINSKRSGYIEFNGSISFKSGNNSLKISSYDKDSSLPNICIKARDYIYDIYESGLDPKIECRMNGKEVWSKTIKVPYQSQLTLTLVNDIFSTGNCVLSSYETSSKLHEIFLDTLLKKQRLIMNDPTIKLCPIT